MPAPTFAQIRKTFIKQPVTTSDVTMLVNSLVDCYGNLMTIGTLGSPFYFTVSPGGIDEEICSATGITQNADGTCTITGMVRGLAATTPYAGGGTPQNHGASTPVVLLPDNPQLLNAIIAYVNSLVLAAAVQATDSAVGYVVTTVTPISNSRVKSAIVSQQASPNATVYVLPFSLTSGSVGAAFAGGSSPSISNPVTNPRIDLVVYEPSSTLIKIRQGSENASITTSNWANFAPVPTSGDVVLAAIFNRHVSGSVTVKDRDDSTNSFIISWYDLGVYNPGIPITLATVNAGYDQQQTVENTTLAVGEANATSKHNLIAQSFIPTVTSVAAVSIYKIADTGSFTGSVKVALQADTGGSPSGSDLASFTLTNAQWAKLPSAAASIISFSTPYTGLLPSATYWIVVTPSTGDNSNHPNLGYDNTSAHSLVLKYNNSTDGWTTLSTAALYFQTLTGFVSQVVSTDTNGEIPLLVRSYALVDIDATGSSVNNSTTETTVYSRFLRSDFFTKNSGLRIRVWGQEAPTSNSNNCTITVKIKYAGNTIAASAGPTCTNGSAVITFNTMMEFIIVNQNSLASQKYQIIMIPTAPTALSASFPANTSVVSGTSSIDLSTGDILSITITAGAATGGISYNGACIEKIS